MGRSRRILLVVVAAVVALALAVPGGAATVTSQVSGGSGSRTMTVKAASGGVLSLLDLGTTGSAPMIVDVVDSRYSHAGFQVSMNASNFYKYAGGTYDCTKSIPSSAFALAYATSPTTVHGVAADVQSVFDLNGSLTGTVATLLGVANGTPISISNLNVNNLEETLAGVYSGAQNTLPVTLAAGSTGAFTNRAAHATCDAAGAGSPTSIVVGSGTKSTNAAMLSWVQSAVTTLADANANGTITGSELLSSGVVADGALSDAVRTALSTAGVSLTTLNSVLSAGTLTMSQIYALLTATLDPVTSLSGATGDYVVVPKISSTIPQGTVFGDYRGFITVTITDV